MTIRLSDIRLLEQTRYPAPTKLASDKPPIIPTAPQVTGAQGLIRIQWATVDGVEGYDIAIMTTPNLANPDVNIQRVMGEKSREFVYSTGNVAITRYFSVRTFLSGYFSDWCPPVSGTSVVFGTTESDPPSPPVNPPSGGERPPSGGGHYNTL